MIGIEVMVGLIILEATGLVSGADSDSYWLLNDMLLIFSFFHELSLDDVLE